MAPRDDSADSAPSSAPNPEVYDHLRLGDDGEVDAARGDSLVPGVYRVVGTHESTVTLLRVGDGEGHRVNTGAVTSVDRESLAAFDAAENPDGNRAAGERASGALSDVAWQLRAFLQGLRARPLATLGAVALIVVGHQGHRVLDVPDWWLTVVYFGGVVAVAYLGSRGG